MLMVKPALTALDVITDLSEQTDLPVLAYQVSGEYAMLRHAAAAGAFDFQSAYLESLLSIRRAGARAVITYGAVEAATWLR